jgi:nucleotide-binding universal stress UspA family protein
MYRRILIATDLSEASLPALRVGLDLARRLGAAVEVLHVTEAPYQSRPWFTPLTNKELELLEELGRREQAEARRALGEQVAEILGGEREQTRVEIVVSPGVPADAIVAAARDRKAELLITGTHGRRGIKHALLGSIAERVMRTAPCPVLTVRAG